MISLTRLSGSQFVLNSDLIERIDKTPDTVITLADGSKYVVSESLADVVSEIRRHRAEIIALSAYVQVGTEPDRGDPDLADLLDQHGPSHRSGGLASVTAHPAFAGEVAGRTGGES